MSPEEGVMAEMLETRESLLAEREKIDVRWKEELAAINQVIELRAQLRSFHDDANGQADEGAAYALQVNITEFQKPESGLDMTAGLVALWSLHDARTRALLWSESITTAFTASTARSGMLDERLQAAIEGVVRENIQLGLEKLSALEL